MSINFNKILHIAWWGNMHPATNGSTVIYPFSAPALLVGRQEGHLAGKKPGVVGSDVLTGDLHVL